MNDDQLLLERLSATDVCPAGSALPEEAWSRDVAFAEIERRVGMQTRDQVERTRAEPQKTRGWLVAAAAFIAVLVVGTATLFWLTRSGGPEVVDEPTTTTVVTTTTTPPPTTAAPSSLNLPDAWQRVGASVMTPVVGIFDMVETSSGLVAVGFDPGEEDMRQNGVILSSTDGVDWTRLAADDPALNLGAVLMYGVAEGRPGIVAVGMGCENDAEPCQAYPTVWTSPDGISWNRSPANPEVFGDVGALLDIVSTDHGLITAGGSYFSEGETELIRPTVWLSADGVEWERAWQGEAYDYSTASVITGFQALATNANGRVVGVGTAVNDEGGFVGAIWTSTDGLVWERIDQNSEVFRSSNDADISILDVAAGPGGFVAVGSDGGVEVAVWHSPDGFSWTRANTTDQPFEYIGTLSAVAALDSGWIMAGPHGFADMAGGTVTLWTSPDGLTWDRVHSIDPGYAMSVVTTDSGIAVAGAMAGVDNYYATVWAGPSFDPLAPPPDPGPTPPPAGDNATRIAEEGLSCDDLVDLGYEYREVVGYWMWYDRPSELDPETTGVPCADHFVSDAEASFGGSDALPVEITSDWNTETFTAAGPAVDAELICTTGTLEPLGGTEEGYEVAYVCDDGSGSFTWGGEVAFYDNSHETDIWGIASGTGDYASLMGGGGAISMWYDAIDTSIGRLWLTAE